MLGLLRCDVVHFVIIVLIIQQYILTGVFGGNLLDSHKRIIRIIFFGAARQRDAFGPVPFIRRIGDKSYIRDLHTGELIVVIVQVAIGNAVRAGECFFQAVL